MTSIVIQALWVYIICILICESYALQPLRDGVNWLLQKMGFDLITDIGEYEFIACRLCVGFWTTLFVGLILDQHWITMVCGYGLAAFMESLEKE